MKKLIPLIIFLCFGNQLFASHIVGGEIEVKKLASPTGAGHTHEVILNLYFDKKNGRPQAEDPSLTVYFFRKKDLSLAGTIVLPQTQDEPIKYLEPSCQIGNDVDLITHLMKYRATADLSKFTDPEGYQVVWERCCRNRIIENIVNPDRVGMTFYLEIPSVAINNSSPHFKDIIADYICKDLLFEMDFSATDEDGDSLSYSMIEPWIGFTNSGSPNRTPIGSNEYPKATWRPGFDLANTIPGEIPLDIDPITGVLKVKTDKLGLFVFSVMVDEFRNGKRIGRVKRDFQIKVVNCKINLTPSIVVREQNTKKAFKSGDVIKIKKGGNRCLDILFTDPDILQKLTITSNALNFDAKKIRLPNLKDMLVSSKSDTLKGEICFENCLVPKANQPADLILTVADNGCPVPLKSAVRLKIEFEENQNTRPTITTSLPVDKNPSVSYGDTLKFLVNGADVDGDTLLLSGEGANFDFKTLGMQFNNATGIGKVSSQLTFIPNCEAIKRNQVVLNFTVKDVKCGTNTQSFTSVPILIPSKANNAPKISTPYANNTVDVVINPNGNQEIKFLITSNDIDNEQISLTGTPKGFDFKNAAMTFTNKNGKGNVVSEFVWTPDCSILQGKDSREFFVTFRSQDNNCVVKQDTVSMKFIAKATSISDNPAKPFNVFTPNGDGINDYFTLGSIPGDNCQRQFVRFQIFNRWGKVVFATQERDFQWDGSGNENGDYLYSLHFTDETYKGVIHLVR